MEKNKFQKPASKEEKGIKKEPQKQEKFQQPAPKGPVKK